MKTNGSQSRIRVLIVDDSLTSRRLHQHIVESDNRFELAGMASDGMSALEMIRTLQPDVVSMDVQMPALDGIEATRLIMQQHPVPILIVSSLYDPSQKELAIRAMAAGAVYIMPKPYGPGHEQYARTSAHYLRMLKNMAGVKVVRRRASNESPAEQSNPVKNKIPLPAASTFDVAGFPDKIVVIGASAGGPDALRIILEEVKPGFRFPIVVVQHIDENFTETFRDWLQTHSDLPVLIAKDGQPLHASKVYLAAGGKHLQFKDRTHLQLSDKPDYKGHKPAVRFLFESARRTFGSDTVAVLLSGMGDDGAEEMLGLKKSGAVTMAQDESSSLVFGMPGVAVKNGGVQFVGTPQQIAQRLIELHTRT